MANKKENYDSSPNIDDEKVKRPLLDQSESPNGISAVSDKNESGINDTSVIIRGLDETIKDRFPFLAHFSSKT